MLVRFLFAVHRIGRERKRSDREKQTMTERGQHKRSSLISLVDFLQMNIYRLPTDRRKEKKRKNRRNRQTNERNERMATPNAENYSIEEVILEDSVRSKNLKNKTNRFVVFRLVGRNLSSTKSFDE